MSSLARAARRAKRMESMRDLRQSVQFYRKFSRPIRTELEAMIPDESVVEISRSSGAIGKESLAREALAAQWLNSQVEGQGRARVLETIEYLNGLSATELLKALESIRAPFEYYVQPLRNAQRRA